MLAGSSRPQVQTNNPTPLVVAGTTTPPTVAIEGDNPATIHVDDTYIDLGAIVPDNEGHSLSYRTSDASPKPS